MTRLFLAILFSILTTGCFGQPGVQQFLRIEAVKSPCIQTRTAHDTMIAVKPFAVFDYLDRLAVLVGEHGVYTPSLEWYWEGSPSEMITGALVAALNCQPGFFARTPYSPSMPHDLVLSGRVESFAVHTEASLFFQVRFHYDVYTKRGTTWLMADDVDVRVPVRALNPVDIAESARQALNKATTNAANSFAHAMTQEISDDL
ncbi:ABC-type transport auxiliary lipoprotein family protein [Desulfovibrio inopinatus]|uniref:ABC-type transport auxiliary lipoprotein family protein n=1 Tax=Desulfovibrio inopinatus TaxID=102109 RepID=UPI0003FCC50C|nr:ABC-type transport auxiliary lipoprotein family protein [Desulfovibrio inopinatus]